MRRSLLLSLALLGALLVPQSAHAREPLVPVSLPVLGSELDRGAGSPVPADPVAPSSGRIVDGAIEDWAGRPSRYGGTAIYSAGEYVYQDHLYDSYGADNGDDVERNQRYEALANLVPETYRLEAASRYLAGELGAPPPIEASTTYGDLGPMFTADLQEVRLATDAADLWVLARTTTLTSADQTGILLLLDTAAGSTSRVVGFNTKLTSTKAEYAVALVGHRGWVIDLAAGPASRTPLPTGSVATQPQGFTNAIEARLPLSALGLSGRTSTLGVAAAAGPWSLQTESFGETDLPANVANVAFRFEEPVREWMERRQAFDLFAGTIDPYFATVNRSNMLAGLTQRFAPGPGYHERIFLSAPNISKEGGRDTIWQHYGLYLPKQFSAGNAHQLQFWLHWRGGTAHSAGTATPRIFRDLGDHFNTIVVSPRGRGTSSWYVGTGQVDVLEVYEDVTSSFRIDRDRVYLAGHSMGGYGSFLFSVLYPDLFAGAIPASPPATQGAWTGVTAFPGCEQITDGEYSPCYIEANNGRAADQHYKRLLGNLRHTPVAIMTGVEDELVPYPGVVRHHLDLMKKWQYRHRLYSFLAQEHYGPPVWDQWLHAGKYIHKFVRDPNPHRVTYRRDMPFERAVEEIHTGGATLSFDFDHAYWMSELTPINLASGYAAFDGRSHGRLQAPYLAVPEAQAPAAPGQTGPYVKTGMRWVGDPVAPFPTWRNAFEATLENASAVKLDLRRMGLNGGSPLQGTVTSSAPLQLRLRGIHSAGTPRVATSTGPLVASMSDGVLIISLPPGTTTFTITP